jgi:hypothetical protein
MNSADAFDSKGRDQSELCLYLASPVPVHLPSKTDKSKLAKEFVDKKIKNTMINFTFPPTVY